MNNFPISGCMSQGGKGILSCPFNPNTGEIVYCTECIHSPRTNIPESKQKFLRDMIFSTGDFDEK